MRTDHRAPGRSGRAGRPGVLRATATTAALVLLTLSSTACSTDAPTDAATPAVAPTLPASLAGAEEIIDPALLEPLAALGPCTIEPNTIEPGPITGLLLPDEAVITEVSDDGPLTTVKGYVRMTPVQMRVWYQLRTEELEILQVEDEVRESEVLVATGDNRLFVKTQALCEQGSVVLAVVAPEAASDAVPAPAGGGGTSGG